MSYEARPNGAHVLTCDSGACNGELLAPTQDLLFQDANLHGWIEKGGCHMCPDCSRGANRMKAMTAMLFGAAPRMVAQADVSAGDPVFDSNGKQVATYKHAAKVGESVEVELYMPIKVEVPVSEKYAEILGTTPSNPAGYSQAVHPGDYVSTEDEQTTDPETVDELFDVFGKGRAVPEERPPEPCPQTMRSKAPVRPPEGETGYVRRKHWSQRQEPAKGRQEPPVARQRTLTAPAGTFGGGGVFKEPERPDPAVVAQAAKVAPAVPKKAHNVRIEKIEETSALFGFLDDRTAWTPDDK